MSKKGDVKRETRPDGKVEVWRLTEIEVPGAAEREAKARLKALRHELKLIDKFDEEEFIAVALEDERVFLEGRREAVLKEQKELEELIGDG